jgi:hypothetical protein
MWFKDVVATGGAVTTADVRAAMALADEVSETIGRTGIAAWFRTVLAYDHLTHGEANRAAQLAHEAVDELVAAQGSGRDYTTRLAEAVTLAIHVADARGDPLHAAQLQRDFADLLAQAGTEAQRMRDEHGELADYAQDFRPSDDE